jgi:hypothetical protein
MRLCAKRARVQVSKIARRLSFFHETMAILIAESAISFQIHNNSEVPTNKDRGAHQ